jgi:hypothetical protein
MTHMNPKAGPYLRPFSLIAVAAAFAFSPNAQGGILYSPGQFYRGRGQCGVSTNRGYSRLGRQSLRHYISRGRRW